MKMNLLRLTDQYNISAMQIIKSKGNNELIVSEKTVL